jgi:hypothetical protein
MTADLKMNSVFKYCDCGLEVAPSWKSIPSVQDSTRFIRKVKSEINMLETAEEILERLVNYLKNSLKREARGRHQHLC